MTRETAEFVIYMINEIANANEEAPSKIYKVLESTGCIRDYLVPFYDVLHTMSSESIMNDIKEFVESRGAKI
ncbi:MAG: DUF3791 domain-containing protein [Ruminococcus sp.]|nr:DUF3791 domain-containing protein [Ruminococcus sp.]